MDEIGKLKPIQSVSLVDRVERRVIKYIKENGLKAGDSLPKEMDFAESLGVSRTAIREAMLRLRTLGLVESKKHRGMVLKTPDLVGNFERMLDPAILDEKMLKSLFEFRLMLEVGMIEFLFARKTEKQMQELEEIVNSTEEHRCDNENFYLESEIRFHGKLYEMAGNEMLEKFQTILMPVFQYVHELGKYETSCLFPEGRRRVTHKDLFNELKNGTPKSMRELMREHLESHYSRALNKQ